MSYILDALKKAERERVQGKGPDILTEPDGDRRGTERRLWPYAVLVMLVAAAGSAGWFLGHEETAVPKPPGPQVVQNHTPPEHQSLQLAPLPPRQAEQIQSRTQVQESAPPLTATSKSARRLTASPDNNNVVDRGDDRKLAKNRTTIIGDEYKLTPTKPFEEYSVERGNPQSEKKNVPDNRTYAISELPESVRQGLPSLTISTHVYSPDRSERLAAINGHIGREGQELMPGFALEAITVDGAILRYQGYRFKVVLK